MAYTQAGIDAFEAAMVDRKGAHSIQLSDGTRTEFETYEDQLAFLAHMKREVNSTPTHRLAVIRKGT